MTGFAALTSAIDYPMLIVTVGAGGERGGCLVGFSTQCSIDPPRYAVCISVQNHTFRLAQRANVLAVHFPERHQHGLAELFGQETGDEVDKFAECRWEPGPDGTPLLADCPNRFVGRVVDRVDAGDHCLYVLDVVEATATSVRATQAGARPRELLTFQQVRDMDPGHPA